MGFQNKTKSRRRNRKIQGRLVARGHTQQKGIDYEEVFAPVARYESIRALLAASVNEEMYIDQMDVVSAYVQGDLADKFSWNSLKCSLKIVNPTWYAS